MSYDELSDEQKQQAKQDYLIGLAGKGVFIRTIYGDTHEKERDPSYGELAAADSLVSDDVMRSQGVNYVPEDFGSDDNPVHALRNWVAASINSTKFREANPGLGADSTAMCYVYMAIDWARGEVLKKCSELEDEQA